MVAYLLLRVNCDKIMHMRWDFDVSNAQAQRVKELNKHQIWMQVNTFVTVPEQEHTAGNYLLSQRNLKIWRCK